MTNKPKLNNSNFAMWRALIALAYADHKLTPAEVEFFKKQLGSLELTDSQKETFSNDLRGGTKIADVYGDISEPNHKTHLLNMAYVLFHRDGNFSKIEKNFYDELYNKHLKALDSNRPSTDHAEKDIAAWDKQRNKAIEKTDSTLLGDIASYFSWLI